MLLEQLPHTCEQPSSFRIVPTDGWRFLPFKHSLMLSSVMILQEQIIIPHLIPIYYSRTGVEVNMPINSWSINLFAAIILSIMMSVGIYMWKQSVATEALIEYKAKEMERLYQEQKKTLEDTRTILKESADIIADLKDKSIKMNEKVKGLEVYLDNHKDEKESSEVLKRTFRELSR
jgi:hypothetical protein